jgi:hypothetical protein
MPSSGSTLPDLTRSLRHFGAAPEALRSAHDRWFQPLLQARPLAPATPELLAASWDGASVHHAWMRVFAELGAVHGTESPAHARAMEARLEQCAEQAVARLHTSAKRAHAVQHARTPEEQQVAWNDWTECLRQLFRAADDAWGCMERELVGTR